MKKIFVVLTLAVGCGGSHSLSDAAEKTADTICHVCDVIDRVCEETADGGVPSSPKSAGDCAR